MKKLFITLPLLIPTLVLASPKTDNLYNQWNKELEVRQNNSSWIGEKRNLLREKIIDSLKQKISKDEITQEEIDELTINSKITVNAINNIDKNRKKIIEKSNCSGSDCNEILYNAYVKRSDQLYSDKTH